MRPASAVFAALLSLAFATGCATAPRADTAAGPAQVADRLFFGQSIPGGGMVSAEEWNAFLRDVITPRFPDGLTVWRADGQWLEARGVLAREPVIVLEVVHEPSPAVEDALREIAEEYKRRFAQEAVLRVTSTVFYRLYEEP